VKVLIVGVVRCCGSRCKAVRPIAFAIAASESHKPEHLSWRNLHFFCNVDALTTSRGFII
jgi:hypothetical protein